jgi:hypothetical protein
VAQKMRRGREQQWTLQDGGTVTLRHAEPATGHATQVAFGITGPKGNGLMMSVPLEPDRIDEAHNSVQLDIGTDIPVDYDDAGCAQLRRSPPMSLVEIVGPKGNGLRVETR